MEDNSPKDEFKISEDKLREYLQSSQKDPDYEVSSDKNQRFSSNPTRDELIEMIQKVYQAVSKLDGSKESQTERCIDLLERLSGACVAQTNVLAEHERAIEQLHTIVKSNNKTIVVLTSLTLLSMSWSLTILAAMFNVSHQ
jgi:regulator of replication initiation timing